MTGLFFILSVVFLFTVLVLLKFSLNRNSSVLLVVYLIVFSFSVYGFVGSPHLIALLEAREIKMAEIKKSILINSDAVKLDPNNLNAWVSLGQAFIETGQFDAAANAFKQSVKLSAGEPKLILAYAKSMIMDEGGKVSDHSKKSLEMVLLQDQKNPEARYWLILRKLEDGDNQNAMQEMKALYRELPEGSALKTMIDRQIGKN